MGITRRASIRLVIAGVTLIATGRFALAGKINTNGSDFAIQGYDPVAYFTDDKAVKGDPMFSAEHNGAVYHFASAEHRDMFKENPDKYAPQYGGYCAYGVAKGVKAGIEPDKFTVVDGKLYLNYNASVQNSWRKDIPGYLMKSEENWPQLGAN